MIIHDPTKISRPAAKSSALVEFVDLMPTVVQIALGQKTPLCPPDASKVKLCTEGHDLSPIMADPTGTKDVRKAAFMQYAACMHDEGVSLGFGHDGCDADDEPMVMGYAMRTRRWRYIEWVKFNKGDNSTAPAPDWTEVVGTELYDHGIVDSVENVAESVNAVADPQFKATVAQLSKQLRAGWRKERWELQ